MTEPETSAPRRGCVALTGATGFVGQHILRRLIAEGWRVRALARRLGALSGPPGALTSVPGDLDNDAALAELVAGADSVVHCAGLVAARSAAEFERVNAGGTARLLSAAAAAGRPRFVLISSLAAREPQLSSYAHSKRAAEEVLRQNAALPWQALRPPVVYGPGDRATLPLFRQFAAGLVLRPAGGGRFSMLYVEDLASAVAALLAQAAPGGRVLELDDGAPGGYGWEEVLAAAERQTGRRVRALAVPRAVQRLAAAAGTFGAIVRRHPPVFSQGKVNEIAHPDWVCRHDLLGDCISWRPAVGLDEGFARTLAWYKAAGWLRA